MEFIRICLWTISVLFSLSSIKGAKVLYLNNKVLNGYICPSSDVTFTLTAIGQIGCTTACESHQTCESVFYHAASSTCYGCTGYYHEGSLTSMSVMSGTRYYQKSLGGPGCNTLLSYYRLCDGGGMGIPSDSSGRVELWYQGAWYTVCNDHWGDGDAVHSPGNVQVMCRKFGYYNGGTEIASIFYISNVIPIIMDNLSCTGTETSLFQCPGNPLFSHNCGTNEAVGVICNTNTLK